MTRIVVSLLSTLVSMWALGGCCNFESEHTEEEQATTPSEESTGSQGCVYNDVSEAEVLQGGMGPVAEFGQRFPEMRITGSHTRTTVRIDAEDTSARWWVMTSLMVQGGLNHAALRPGARLVFSFARPSVNGLQVYVLGCSGPRRPHYTYDQYADTVTVDVLPGSSPSMRRMVFTAVFPPSTMGGPPQRVRGAFEYEPR